MPSPSSFSARERQLRSRLHFLLTNAEDFIHGSLIEMARKCGSPQCRCASDEEAKHRSLYLGQTREGKRSMIYLPKNLEPQVRRATEHFQQALSLLEELNDEARLRLDKSKSKNKNNKKKKNTRKKAASKKAASKKTLSKKIAPKKKPPKPS